MCSASIPMKTKLKFTQSHLISIKFVAILKPNKIIFLNMFIYENKTQLLDKMSPRNLQSNTHCYTDCVILKV